MTAGGLGVMAATGLGVTAAGLGVIPTTGRRRAPAGGSGVMPVRLLWHTLIGFSERSDPRSRMGGRAACNPGRGNAVTGCDPVTGRRRGMES